MANELMREQWTKYGGPAWVEHHEIFESVFAPFNEAAIGALGPSLDGLTVLDIGCGSGSLCAAVLDHGGTAVGVDISATMVAGARELVPAARFEVADAQVDSLGALVPGGFDRVTSRFGVMFFDDPVAGFSNIRMATKAGGRMAFVCWRSLDDNPNFSCGTHVLVERMPEPLPPAGAGAPGPTAFADPDVVTAILTEAGWGEVAATSFDAICSFGINGSDGVEERMAMLMATQTGRLAAEQLRPTLDDDAWQALLEDVRADVRTAMVDGVVQFPGRTWVVTAANGRPPCGRSHTTSAPA